MPLHAFTSGTSFSFAVCPLPTPEGAGAARVHRPRSRSRRRARDLVALTRITVLVAVVCAAALAPSANAQAAPTPESIALRETYDKREVRIPMRDGVELFTAIYTPKAAGSYPILLSRTPYSAAPYGEENFPRAIGPGAAFAAAGYIFVTQDVRGRYHSGGSFMHMTPHKDVKKGPRDVNESTDTYDTIDWLVQHVPRNNGRVGLWGISYGGFFAAAGMIDAHPALKAVSPQAPQTDWFLGDDTHHNGAFFLTSTFNFMAMCGRRTPGASSMSCGKPFDFGAQDGYDFFLSLGPLANVEKRYFKGAVPGWSEMMAHGTYDSLWQARAILPHIRKITPAVLTVGGWYDANNFYGALHLFQAVERQSPATNNAIVIGPWSHGQWARDSGVSVGKLSFGMRTSDEYQERILLPFFEAHLKLRGTVPTTKAYVFETGTNRWRRFDKWPPAESKTQSFYLGDGQSLAGAAPRAGGGKGYEEWVTDPAHPAPFVPAPSTDMDPDYMAQDQRFGAGRPDAVVYRGPTLSEELTIAGPVRPTLFVSTTGTDGDWVVKLIDMHPDGFQELVRGDVMRAKFRKSFTTPEPLTPGQVTQLDFEMPDVFHTFRRGHQMLVQVQGSWFPLVDRNPNTFVDIYKAKASDFHVARQRVYQRPGQASRLEVQVLAPATIP